MQMAIDTAALMEEMKAYVAELIKGNDALGPKGALAELKKRFKKGVWIPKIAEWFEELKPGYKARSRKERKGHAEKAAVKRAAKAAGKAAGGRKPGRPAAPKAAPEAPVKRKPGRPKGSVNKKPRGPKPGRPAGRPAVNGERYLVESHAGAEVYGDQSQAMDVVNAMLAQGAGLADVRLSRIVPVELQLRVVAQ